MCQPKQRKNIESDIIRKRNLRNENRRERSRQKSSGTLSQSKRPGPFPLHQCGRSDSGEGKALWKEAVRAKLRPALP